MKETLLIINDLRLPMSDQPSIPDPSQPDPPSSDKPKTGFFQKIGLSQILLPWRIIQEAAAKVPGGKFLLVLALAGAIGCGALATLFFAGNWQIALIATGIILLFSVPIILLMSVALIATTKAFHYAVYPMVWSFSGSLLPFACF